MIRFDAGSLVVGPLRVSSDSLYVALYREIVFFFFFYGDFVISLYHRHNRQIGGIGNVSNPLYGYARVEQRKFKY